MTSSLIRSSIFGIAALLALVFIPAGTVRYWQGWAFVAVWIIASESVVTGENFLPPANRKLKDK